ncbi:phage shock protein PspA [soil metagenome]
MFERLKNIINAMFNKGMSKMETPEVLAEQAQSELEGSFKKLREALTSSLANEKMMEKQIQKATEELATWEKRATVAVGAGNDEVAKECLVRKQEQNQNIQSLQSQLAAQKQNSATLKERYQEVEAKLKSFMSRKNDMISRHKASDAVTKADSLISSGGGGSGLDKWEQKISEKEARAEAIREISGGGNSSTEDKFKKLDKHIEMEDELAALKARMADAGKSPKLIVDGGKTQVDANVPMIVEVIEPGDKSS